ncbi:hypothetical protein QQX98_000729 [Neonectria punicea]|uniref:Glucose-methanol-choline oxidoreductase N-terminal domain-containing protein n=1 Tax=Neonectria punicea TaxID=979145 RepID=A0ABR1HSH9_9HYPO
MSSVTYDYVIVGGGLAGCVLASRLREYNEEAKIVLIEAGPHTRSRPDVLNPQVLNLGGDLDWQYQSKPMHGISNRSIVVNSGKGLGGGSSINSGGWTRGSAADYDEWATLVGDERYSYKGQQSRTTWIRRANLNRVCRGKFPLSEDAAAAWDEMGVAALPGLDQNAGDNLGRAYICQARRDGVRSWSAGSYPLDGVEIRFNMAVNRVILDSSSGVLKATGVVLVNGTVVPSKVVVSAAGTFRSPQLLQLSGIGSADDLKECGIDPLVDLPDVGKGLTDHMSFFQHWRVRDPSAGYTLGSPNPLFEQPQYSQGVPLDWIVSTTVPKQGLEQAITKDEDVKPDATKHSLLSKPRTFLENIVLCAKLPFPGVPMDAEHITTAVVNFLPTSRGSVSLRLANPEDPLKIDFNYLATHVDKYVFREGLRQLTQYMLGSSFSQFIVGESVPGGLGVQPLSLNDNDEKLDNRLAMTS